MGKGVIRAENGSNLFAVDLLVSALEETYSNEAITEFVSKRVWEDRKTMELMEQNIQMEIDQGWTPKDRFLNALAMHLGLFILDTLRNEQIQQEVAKRLVIPLVSHLATAGIIHIPFTRQ